MFVAITKDKQMRCYVVLHKQNIEKIFVFCRDAEAYIKKVILKRFETDPNPRLAKDKDQILALLETDFEKGKELYNTHMVFHMEFIHCYGYNIE